MKLNHDLHLHTYLSACCSAKDRHRPAAILALAEEMGVETIGFSDHIWMNPHVQPSEWYRPQDASHIQKLREDLQEVDSTMRVLVGCEADTVSPGKFSITPEFASELDHVLLACSHFHMTDFVEQPESRTPQALARHMLKFFNSAVRSGLATSIPHPLFPIGYLEIYDAAVGSIPDAEFFDVFSYARECNVALEITTAFLIGEQQGLFSLNTPLRYLAIAKETGCKFTLGTDAHSPEEQRRLPELDKIIQAMNLSENDFLRLPP